MPREAAVPDDGQQPGSRAAIPIAFEIAQCAQHGILDSVLRVVLVAQQIPRERVRIVQVRKDDSLEPFDVALSHGSSRA
jgi:hypothetical protein